jgi:hypothetical protein
MQFSPARPAVGVAQAGMKGFASLGLEAPEIARPFFKPGDLAPTTLPWRSDELINGN